MLHPGREAKDGLLGWGGKGTQPEGPQAACTLPGAQWRRRARLPEMGRRWDAAKDRGPGVGTPAVPSPPKGPFSFWLQVTTQKRSQNRKGFGFFNPSPGSE